MGKVDIKEVLPHIILTGKKRRKPGLIKKFHGKEVIMNSLRLRVFVLDGTTCRGCGIEAAYFAVECASGTNAYHLNMYSANDVLFTKDHIRPKDKGGTDSLENLQTMCTHCNGKKANAY